MSVITGADLHDRQFTGYRGRWRYRTKVEFEAGGPLKTLFKRRYDAANFLADVRAFGVEKAMRELDNRGHRYGIDFKDDRP